VRRRARRDARCLEEAGVDALLVENFGDAPFFPDAVPPETLAAMAVIAAEIAGSTRLPVGANVLRNDAHAALALAAAAGLQFIRVNVHAGARVTDQGLLVGRASETLRLRRALGIGGVALLADVAVKHSAPLAARPLGEEARELCERALADVLLVTGSGTGLPPSPAEVAEVRGAAGATPVLVASGVDAQTAGALLAHADGCIVGSALKRNGRAENEVELERARGVIEVIKAQRTPGGTL
jgi:hypothetical protein